MIGEKSILIIEDEAPLKAALKYVFSSKDYIVQEAGSGVDALEKLKSFKPTVILTDISMPDMNGLEFITQLRENEWGKNAHVVVLSNFDSLDLMSKALEMGVREYFVKSSLPIDKIVEHVEKKCAELLSKAD
jgi:YesN/AraC family two-component response regulator